MYKNTNQEEFEEDMSMPIWMKCDRNRRQRYDRPSGFDTVFLVFVVLLCAILAAIVWHNVVVPMTLPTTITS